MDAPNLIALSIPLFFVLIGIELLFARRRGVSLYRLPDAIADLGCGIGQQVPLVFYGTALLAVYAALYEHRFLTFAESSAAPWLIAFVAVDFVYYWWHRLSHEVNLLWAAHVVHHQSEDYNLAVALRQSTLTSFTSLPFNLPLALIGVPPVVYAVMVSLSTLYQFWIHTRLVGKLGPVEWVLNTPSHHRVHHAINPHYLDKNYGATLIVWDRLFGTFAAETEEPVYGTIEPLRSFNPVWAQLAYWPALAHKVGAQRGWFDKVAVLFRSPAWNAAGEPVPDVRSRPKHDPPLARGVRVYVGLQFVPVVVVTFLLMWWQTTLPGEVLAAGGAFVGASLLSLGGLLDGARWARAVEGARMLLLLVLAVALYQTA